MLKLGLIVLVRSLLEACPVTRSLPVLSKSAQLCCPSESSRLLRQGRVCLIIYAHNSGLLGSVNGELRLFSMATDSGTAAYNGGNVCTLH
jgi:hypothetical protein